MTQLTDLNCWIKVINDGSGKSEPDGTQFIPPGTVVVRYSFANDSHKAASLWVVGTLSRDGVTVKPNGQPNVVPAQQVTVQPGEVWSKEHTVSEGGNAFYKAKLLADPGNWVNEEDEKNNKATKTFSFLKPPA
jgi:hypothetical protein